MGLKQTEQNYLGIYIEE